jgi:ribosomal-protein-alanine N-acetyltransferase
MRLDDLPEVLAIETLSFRPPWSKRLFLQELAGPGRYYVVVEYQGKVIGYAGLLHLFGEGHITTLAVAPDFRAKGVGSYLIEFLLNKARELKLQLVTLEVRESNVAAQRLYKKFGFKVMGRRRKYYSQPREDGFIMRLILKDSLKDNTD